jgi:hypothetical protein
MLWCKVGAVDGLTGRCYALPTKGFSIEELSNAVIRFEKFVRENCKYQFLVTAIGCGHAGFDVMKVANMFRGLLGLSNVMLPEAYFESLSSRMQELIFIKLYSN